jgi:hypothetical protein
MLLRRMADFQPALVEQATESLGVPRRAVAEANRRWQARLRSRHFPGGAARYRLVLGAPAAQFTRRFGALTSEVTQWPVPLWPELRFEVIAVPGGPVLQEWLVRPDPATRPGLATAADVRPWTCVITDLDHAFAPVRHGDGDAPTRWSSVFTAPGPGGMPRPHHARFVWGLVQTVTPLDADEIAAGVVGVPEPAQRPVASGRSWPRSRQPAADIISDQRR